MPDSDGRLSADEKKTVETWLRDKWLSQNIACPVSGHEEWIIADHVIQTPIYIGKGFLVGGPTYPHVFVVCGGCGYELLFSAVMMEITQPPSVKASEPAEGSDGGK